MNNSSMRFYTLASCGGLLALTACGGQEANTPPVEPTQSANTPPPRINLRSQSVIPLPRPAMGPELSPTALVRSRAIALSGGGSPFSDQEIQARLQQARLKREQLTKTRLAQLEALRSPVASSTITSLPQRPISLNPRLPKPLIPTPPLSPTLHRETITTGTSQALARSVGPVADVHGSSPDATSLSPTPGVAPKPGSACPGLLQPSPIQSSLATGKMAVPAPANTSAPIPDNSVLPTTDQVTNLSSPDSAMTKALVMSYHQSYSATRGAFPCLTATRLPSQAMRLHSQVLNQNPQGSIEGSSIPIQGRVGGESLRNLLGFRSLSPNQGQGIDNASQSPLALPETARHTPGFSSSSLAQPGAATEALNNQGN